MFVINETMDFSSIIFKRDNGFCAKRWYFFELIAKRFDAFIRHSRVWLPQQPSPTKGFLSWLGSLRWHQSWVYSGVAHIQFRVYSGVEYSHVYSTQLSRIYECILNTLYWVDTHTLYSAELNASALLYSAELSRTECLSMSIAIYSLPDWS